MISFITSFLFSMALASVSPTGTISGRVIIVDVDKIVITQNSRRIEIPAKFIKQKYKVGETAEVEMSADEIGKLRSETLPKK